MHPPSKKGGCWNGCRKRVSLSVIQKNCVCWNRYCYSVFSKAQQLHKKLHMNRNLCQIVGCCSSCARSLVLVGWCLARFVLNGWMCGVGVFLCSFLVEMVLCFVVVYLVQLQMCYMPFFQCLLASLVGFVLLFGSGRFRVRWGPFLLLFSLRFLLFFVFLFVLCLVFLLDSFGWNKARRASSHDLKPSWFLLFVCCFLSWKV